MKNRTRFSIGIMAAMLVCWGFLSTAWAQETEVKYLSGKGSDDAVKWDFFCTDGMNSGKWTTIDVPSCWELQGFGKYNYGFQKDSARGMEKGMYKHEFEVPADWKGKVINIVFEGVFTDADVKINGKKAGIQHQGAYYVFKYDISKLLNYGKSNLLEVTVAKHSANESVNQAERRGDFWLCGGIFRPVFLEALPAAHISNVAINAKANGQFTANVYMNNNKNAVYATGQIYNLNGEKVWGPFRTNFKKGTTEIQLGTNIDKPKLWNPETPNLYNVVFELYDTKGEIVHSVKKRFGFRTVEVKQRDGIYVNGVKVKMKGVNRHSFWPTTGRTLNYERNLKDAQTIKEMNMNAVRNAHYPSDESFLDICDSLGLFVMDELAGWHGNYDTITGAKLLKEMIDFNVNHPSIVIWANGNEGGHNFGLDSLFTAYDIQKRPVVHPWQLFGGIETQHYREYNYGIGNYDNGREIILPTEFLHGQYDGGHGAGLEDYWKHMWYNPQSAGGFLWDFADNAVVRKDKNDILDTDKDRAADGILGAYHEREGSFYTIKEVWSPIFFERRFIAEGFDGSFDIENRYHYTNIKDCNFSWELKKLGDTLIEKGTVAAPDLKPLERGKLKLKLPEDYKKYDVLYITANGPDKKEIFTWSFSISSPKSVRLAKIDSTTKAPKVTFTIADSAYNIIAGSVKLSINQTTGLLKSVTNAKGEIPFVNGPIIDSGVTNFKNFVHKMVGDTLLIESTYDKKESYNVLRWTIYPSGIVKMKVEYFPAHYHTPYVGVNFNFPEDQTASVDYMGNGPYRVWKNRLKGNKFGIWHKDYNNTETGEYPIIYPEFKGYHSNMYWLQVNMKNSQHFKVSTDNEDLFFRLFTPAWKDDPWHNYNPKFPKGDISFLQGISGIGTKTQRADYTGPMSRYNVFYDYEKDVTRALQLTLFFDFSGK